MRRNESSFTVLQAAAAVAAAADGMAFDRPKNENHLDYSAKGSGYTTNTAPRNVIEFIPPIMLTNTVESNNTTTTAFKDNHYSNLSYIEQRQPKNGHGVAKLQSVEIPKNERMKNHQLNHSTYRMIQLMAEVDSSFNNNICNKNKSEKSFNLLDRNDTGLRKGKWTPEEEQYAMYLIQLFKSGMLPLSDGMSLRTFLSTALNCDPMRISKKFVGSNCIGKQVFRHRDQDANHYDIAKHCKELGKLKKMFLSKTQNEVPRDPPVNKPKRQMKLKRRISTRDDSPATCNGVFHVPIDQGRVLSKRIQPSNPNWVPFSQGSITEDIQLPSGGGVNVENRMWGQFDVAVEPALTVGSVGIQEVHDTRGMPTVYNVPSVQMTDVMNSIGNQTTDELAKFLPQSERSTSPPVISAVPCVHPLRSNDLPHASQVINAYSMGEQDSAVGVQKPTTPQPILGYDLETPLGEDAPSCSISRDQ